LAHPGAQLRADLLSRAGRDHDAPTGCLAGWFGRKRLFRVAVHADVVQHVTAVHAPLPSPWRTGPQNVWVIDAGFELLELHPLGSSNPELHTPLAALRHIDKQLVERKLAPRQVILGFENAGLVADLRK
jgi:hypothetical protein